MPELTNLKKMLADRGVPSVWSLKHPEQELYHDRYVPNFDMTNAVWQERRREIVELLAREQYGFLPPAVPYDVEIVETTNTCALKAKKHLVHLTLHCPKGDYVLPFWLVMPVAMKKVPMFVCINFRSGSPDAYIPMEEIVDAGFGIAAVYYKDISDDSAKEDGVYPLFDRDEDTGYGKISLWAWGMSRIIDYLLTIKQVDENRIAVCGHSRLGKTALWCGANDERVSCSFSNDSGCAGAAIYRGKIGETTTFISKTFPFWFCKNYFKHVGNDDNLPFDQHYLVAALAPRCVYVASAEQDDWADPTSEFLSCVAATEVYDSFGIDGLITPDRLPETGEYLHRGFVGYHIRFGGHFFSREDWNMYFKFRYKHGI